MLTCFWKKNYPAESCMSSLVTSSEHNFELNFAMLNNKTYVFSWKEKALSVNRLHSIHSSTYEKATHKRQIKWKCFCTFGVRFLCVFSTSSPAILKNCILNANSVKASHPEFGENTAFPFWPPCSVNGLIELGQKYANPGSRSYQKGPN